MKKIIIFICIIITAVITLSSCKPSFSDYQLSLLSIGQTIYSLADLTMEKITEAVNEDDIQKLRDVFCWYFYRNESSEEDNSQIIAFFDYINGDILSYKNEGTKHVHEEGGRYPKEIPTTKNMVADIVFSLHSVQTETETYYFAIYDRPYDDIMVFPEPPFSYEDVNSISVWKASEIDMSEINWTEKHPPGIYLH